MAMKYAYLLNLSTTTNITSLSSDLGKPSIKSILISMNGVLGMGSGYRNLGVRVFF
jgi:hypothetical protein